MTSIRRIPPLLLLAATALGGVLGCALPKEVRPSVRAIQPRISGIGLEGVDLVFDVTVNNPYPAALTAPRVRYALGVEGKPLLNGVAEGGADLPAGGTGLISFPARVGYADLTAALARLDDANEAAYTLDGGLGYSALGAAAELPLSYAGRFPILRVPTVVLERIDPSQFSWNSAKLDLKGRISNPNVFDIDIRDLGYELRLGSASLARLSAGTGGRIAPGKGGPLSLMGEVTAMEAFRSIYDGGLSRLAVRPTGRLATPYGPVELGDGGAR